MKSFVDTADKQEIRDLATTDLLDGVPINPSPIHKSTYKFLELEEIGGILSSARRVHRARSYNDDEGRRHSTVDRPQRDQGTLTIHGLKTYKSMSANGLMVNVPLHFSAKRALFEAGGARNFHFAVRRPPQRRAQTRPRRARWFPSGALIPAIAI